MRLLTKAADFTPSEDSMSERPTNPVRAAGGLPGVGQAPVASSSQSEVQTTLHRKASTADVGSKATQPAYSGAKRGRATTSDRSDMRGPSRSDSDSWLLPDGYRVPRGGASDILIVRGLGQGGMGQVYLGRYEDEDRYVAVKTIRQDVSDGRGRQVPGGKGLLTPEEQAGRFENEAQAAALGQHPNIVQVLDFFEFEPPPGSKPGRYKMLVMEYIEGINLFQFKALMGHELIPWEIAAQLALHMLQACDWMWETGRQSVGLTEPAKIAAAQPFRIVHRDLKFANVMMSEAGVLKIVDFGLLYSPQEGSRRYETEEVGTRGSVRYMPLEQAEGGKREDGRADVYAIGVMLYDMLSNGLHPFRGFDEMLPAAQAVALAAGERVPLSEALVGLRDDVPGWLCDLVDELVAHSPENRPFAKQARDLLIGNLVHSFPEVQELLGGLVTDARCGRPLVLPSQWQVEELGDDGGFDEQELPELESGLLAAEPPSRPGRLRWKLVAGLSALLSVMAAVVAYKSELFSSYKHPDVAAEAPGAGVRSAGEAAALQARPLVAAGARPDGGVVSKPATESLSSPEAPPVSPASGSGVESARAEPGGSVPAALSSPTEPAPVAQPVRVRTERTGQRVDKAPTVARASRATRRVAPRPRNRITIQLASGAGPVKRYPAKPMDVTLPYGAYRVCVVRRDTSPIKCVIAAWNAETHRQILRIKLPNNFQP